MCRYILTFTLLIFLSSLSISAEQTAVLTKFYGKVRLFKKPSNVKEGPGPFVKIDSTYYTVYKAKKGHRLHPNERVQTGPKSKAKLVYPNGDQIVVSADTAYQISQEGESGIKRPILDMVFGKIRGLIRPEGPRAGMKVRSSSMVMGVRGTDFYVSARGKSGHSEISVLRGKVEVKSRSKEAKTQTIEAGYSAEVVGVPDEGKDQAPVIPVVIRPNTKAIVAKIYEETVISPKEEALMAQEKAESPEVEEALAMLETKAIEAVKHDIRVHEPELYKKIEKVPAEKITSADLLQALTTKKAHAKAPKETKTKAKYHDFEVNDTYDKYLKD